MQIKFYDEPPAWNTTRKIMYKRSR